MLTHELEQIILKTQAVQEVDKLMNKYEYLLSHARLEEVEQLFALNMPDVRLDLSFGRWIGPEGVHRCIIGLHGKLFRSPDGQPAVGCFHLNANTTSIIEIADDLKTAKGLWVCPGTYNNPSDETESGAISMAGACLRTCDFIFDETSRQWKMWHYVVTGLFSYYFGESPATTKGNQSQEDWEWLFDDTNRPDGPPPNYWMYTAKARVENKAYNRVPEPYRTWSETFSY